VVRANSLALATHDSSTQLKEKSRWLKPRQL
jgi:hypothetical protein